jgi:aryl-alcohol dehydrogenase-like predicted oxidoreductase
MKYRLLGKTGLTVSEIGFGAWGIGGATDDGPNSYGATDDGESLRALAAAFDKGITLYDTSNIYGYGHSEELIGKAFKGMREKVIIASKVGFVKYGAPLDITPAHIRVSLEATLRRLQTDYVDLYQLHSPSLELLEKTPEAVDELRTLKREGKIRAFGFSAKNPGDAIAAIKKYGFEAVQVNFNMIDQRAVESGLFDCASEYGAGVIARTPLAFGFLTGKVADMRFDPHDHRSLWSEGQLKRWTEAPDLFSFINQGKNRTPAQLALKFCLGFKAVSAVIPGMLHLSEVEENAQASDTPPLGNEELDAVAVVYKSHEFFDKSVEKHE